MRLARLAQLAATLACATTLTADYRYEETTKVTGGTILRLSKFPGLGKMTAPTTAVHYYKGGKSAMVTGSRIDIIDADQGMFIVVDTEKKTFATITFEEFKAALEAMARKGTQQTTTGGQMSFDLKVRDLGTSKTLLNMEAKGMELKLTMTVTDPQTGQSAPMDITSEMYMAKDLPGSSEMREFQLKMAKKLDWDARNSRYVGMNQMQPGFSEGMQKLSSEARKLEGTPLMTITKMMGMPGGGEMPETPETGAPSSGQISDAASQAAKDESAREAAYQTSRAAGGRFGGLAGAAAGGLMGGLGRKKPKEQPKEEAKAPAAAPAAPSGPKSFMETTSEIISFSSDPINASQFGVPTGFKEVEHEMKKLLKSSK